MESFRPVKEEWGEPCKGNRNQVVRVIRDIAEMAHTRHTTKGYGDVTVVWVENGRAFLDLLACLSIKTAVLGEVDTLILRMRACGKRWKESLGRHGELRFYID